MSTRSSFRGTLARATSSTPTDTSPPYSIGNWPISAIRWKTLAGWLALRTVQEPFTCFADRLADYETFSGTAVDLDRVRYYRLFAEFKVVILGFRRTVESGVHGEIGNALIYEVLHNSLFAEALAEQYGLKDLT